MADAAQWELLRVAGDRTAYSITLVKSVFTFDRPEGRADEVENWRRDVEILGNIRVGLIAIVFS